MKLPSLPHSTALVIIDMQLTYLATPELAAMRQSLVQHTNELIKLAGSNRWLIINVVTLHARDKSTWTRNMIEDNQGFAFADQSDSDPLPDLDLRGARSLTKTRDNAFHGTELLSLLTAHSITDIVLCGVSASSCIFHTAVAAYAYDFAVTLYTPAIGDEDSGRARYMEDYLRTEYRQRTASEL